MCVFCRKYETNFFCRTFEKKRTNFCQCQKLRFSNNLYRMLSKYNLKYTLFGHNGIFLNLLSKILTRTVCFLLKILNAEGCKCSGTWVDPPNIDMNPVPSGFSVWETVLFLGELYGNDMWMLVSEWDLGTVAQMTSVLLWGKSEGEQNEEKQILETRW